MEWFWATESELVNKNLRDEEYEKLAAWQWRIHKDKNKELRGKFNFQKEGPQKRKERVTRKKSGGEIANTGEAKN